MRPGISQDAAPRRTDMSKNVVVLGALMCLALLVTPVLADEAPATKIAPSIVESGQGCVVVETASISGKAELNDVESSLLLTESSQLPADDASDSRVTTSAASTFPGTTW